MQNTTRESGFFNSIKQLLSTALEIAQVRLELVGTEVEREKRRLFDGLFWGAIALLCIGVGLTLLCGFIILLLWDGYRLAAIGLLSVLFIAMGAVLALRARKKVRNQSTMFNASLSELKQDQAALRPQTNNEPH
ncbi:phage holin family protein [Rhodoferax sp. PAMC 29310]|uniref:phage holin family protein n=1 Tax=Rhodoferax sp. PAMC 29310 TaxID=2822760 RepID=UPI001B3406E0|nr:phage holin family protein [Rhodoferax sp. PAMC 29310]